MEGYYSHIIKELKVAIASFKEKIDELMNIAEEFENEVNEMETRMRNEEREKNRNKKEG